MFKVAVIGAGPMGLMCALRLLQQGISVTLFERDDRIGGMTASFDFDGLEIERFYHFVCATDTPTFELLKELGLSDKLHWRRTKMGFYYQGQLYPWGDPISLLRFPHLSLWQKLRYGLFVMRAKGVADWKPYDKLSVKNWLLSHLGKKIYDILWRPLFALKFDRHHEDLSAAWLGARIKRVALSRSSVFHESLGYIEGGSATLLNALEKRLHALGGHIRLSSGVQEIVVENNKVVGIKVEGKLEAFSAVVSTVPLPYVNQLMPKLDNATRRTIEAIANVGVVCVLFKLNRQFSPNFWMNITDDAIEIPGLIEYTNLQQYEASVLYAPYYMSESHRKVTWTDTQFVAEVKSYLKKINPEFSDDWILGTHVARYRYAQTVCTPDFYRKLPPMRSLISGFYMADTAFYYPEDRSIAESVRVGEQLASLINEDRLQEEQITQESQPVNEIFAGRRAVCCNQCWISYLIRLGDAFFLVGFLRVSDWYAECFCFI